MQRPYLHLQKLANVAMPSLMMVATCLFPWQALAQSWEVSLIFPEGQTDRGAPNRTAGAGTRSGGCLNPTSPPLTAVMPKNNLGTTTQSHPSFFVYVPETQATQAEVLLYDANDQEIYSQTLTLPKKSGVMEVSFPKSVQLSLNQKYNWSFMLLCNQDLNDANVVVEGTLKRQPQTNSLTQKLAQATTPLDYAQAYAEEGIWIEALTILAYLRDSHPHEWSEMLNSVELGQIAEAPLRYNIDSKELQQFVLTLLNLTFPTIHGDGNVKFSRVRTNC